MPTNTQPTMLVAIKDGSMAVQEIVNDSAETVIISTPVDYIEGVATVITGTATDLGTEDAVVTIGGLSGVVGTDIDEGTDEITYAAGIVAWIEADDNLDLIPAASVTDEEDGTFVITGLDGAEIVTETDDTELSFDVTVEGVIESVEVSINEVIAALLA